MTRLRLGILGRGGMGRRHAQAARRLVAEVELVAFCDRTERTAQEYAAQLTDGRAGAFTDLGRMLGSARLDVLVVCLPPHRHAGEVEAAAAAGVHLLLEKPLALDPAQAWHMVHATEAAGVRTQVGFMYRFGAAVEAFVARRQAGSAGRVGMFDARYYCHALHAPWWRDLARSGGQLIEQVIHHVDLMRYLMGEPDHVFASQGNVFHRRLSDYTVEDVGVAVATYRDGAVGVLRHTNGAVPGVWDKAFSVVADGVTLHATDPHTGVLHRTPWADGRGGTAPAVEAIASEDRALEKQLLDLVTAVRTGADTRTPARDGARSLDLALAMRRSAATGEPVAVGPEDR